MEVKWLIVGCLLVTIYLSTTEARKNKGGRANANSTECLGEPLQESKFLQGLEECTKEYDTIPQTVSEGGGKKQSARARKRAMKKNQMCIKLCQRKRQGIIDSTGKISEAGANNFISEIFPQKAQRRIQRGLTRCAEDYSDGFVSTDSCKEYRRFEKCLTRIIVKSCGMKNERSNGNNRREKSGRRGNKKGTTSADHLEDETGGAEGHDY